MSKNKSYTSKDAMGILGYSYPTLKLMMAQAQVDFSAMTNPETGRPCNGLTDKDLDKIRKLRKQPGRDNRKP